MAMIWREKLRTENALIGEKQQRELACQKDDEALRAAEEAEDQRQRAETGFNKAREAINRMLTRVYYNLGQFLSDGMGDFHRAIDPLRRAIELSPETTEYRAMLARAHRRGGELGQALTVLEELIRLEPSCAHGYMERGWVHQEAGNFERFLADAQRAVELDPLCGRCQESLADAHVFLGQSDEALAVLNRALEVPWSGGQYESRGGHYAARSWVYGIRGEIHVKADVRCRDHRL